MNNQGLQLFIVDDDLLAINNLQIYLQNKFGTLIDISVFHTGERVLKAINQDTSIVILDYILEGENGNDILKSIKKINPKTEVIMLSSNEEVGVAIDSFRKGATDYVVKGEKAWRKLIPHIYRSIAEPIRKMGKEYGLGKFLLIFLITFISVGIIAWVLLKIMPH